MTSNRSQLAAFDIVVTGRATLQKTGLAAPFARQEESDEYYR